MCANDLPPVRPNDALSTCCYIQFPSTFVDADDERLLQKTPGFRKKDDTIKEFCQKPSTQAAITHILLESYGKVEMTDEMLEQQQEFATAADERAKFFEHYTATTSDEDFVPSCNLQRFIKDELPGVTMHRVNRWLRDAKCKVGEKRRNDANVEQRVVKRLKRVQSEASDEFI